MGVDTSSTRLRSAWVCQHQLFNAFLSSLIPPPSTSIHANQSKPHTAGLCAFVPAPPSAWEALLSSFPFTRLRRLQPLLLGNFPSSSACPKCPRLGAPPLGPQRPCSPPSQHLSPLLAYYSPSFGIPKVGIEPSFEARAWPKPDIH